MKGEGADTSRLGLAADDVGAFLRRTRSTAREARDHLEKFAQQRLLAQSRVAGITTRSTFERTDLLDELLERDTELSAAADELHAQIDALTKACALLERERSKYVDLFVHAPDAYVITDLRGTAEDANAAAGALLSVDREFLRGRPLVAFVARNDTRAFRDVLGKLGSDPPGGGVHAFTVRMRPRGQPVFVCLARIATVRTSSGKPIALRWTLHRVDAQENADAAHLAHAELARQIVGDFRAPVATIAGWARLLLEGSLEGEDERRQALAWVEQSAAAQRVMLDDLDELSQMLSPRDGPVSLDTVDLVQRVRVAADSLRACVEDSEALVVSEGTHAPAFVRAPAGYLDRAIELLLRRALAGTPRNGGAIRTKVSVAGVQAIVQIEAPDGAPAASGGSVRMASAARIVELCGGSLVLDERSPSSRLTLPIATR